MVPSYVVVLDIFPLSINAKLDTNALPPPGKSLKLWICNSADESSLITQEYVAPRTSIEKRLVEIYKEILGVTQVGIHDNFFELGGHSLLAVKLVTIIERALNIQIRIAQV